MESLLLIPLFILINQVFSVGAYQRQQNIISISTNSLSSSQSIENILMNYPSSKGYRLLKFDSQTQFLLGELDHNDYHYLRNKTCQDCITMESNHQVKMVGKTKTQYDIPSWGLSRISQRELPLNQVYTYPTSAGKDVDIYIVDSGVDINNPDFEGRAEWGANFVKGSPDLDEAGHGTLVAGIAAGASVGVAKKANIISVKCLGKDGNGNIEDIIEGLHYILKRVENNHFQKHKKSIVNISLSSDKNIALNQAVDALSRAGVIVVAAAGNSLPSDNSTIKDSCQKSPASSETAITVGSTDDRDQLSHFSNTGKCVNILAPGEGIISENKDDTIVAYSGTSYSAPHVAGILAIYWSQPQHKNKTSVSLNKSQVIDQLYQLATPNIIKNVTDGTPNLLAFVGTESTHSKLVSSSKHPSQTNQSIKQMPGNLYIPYIFIYLLYSFYIVI